MEVLLGLMDHQVLQRNKKNVSQTILAGRSDVAGKMELRVTPYRLDKPLAGFNWKKIGTVKKGPFKIQLTGIPVGGPYNVSLRVVSSKNESVSELKFQDIFVGDVWILAGQSNMEGYGHLTHTLKPDPHVRAFYSDDTWAVAQDPIHVLHRATDSVHIEMRGGTEERPKHIGESPCVSFGQTMFKSTGVPQGLIACAHGGTSMQQWDPALKKLQGKSLYGATIRRFIKNGSNVAGVLWYQGCSDAGPAENVQKYTTRMKNLVAAFRRDFAKSDLPFIMVQIANFFADLPGNVNPAFWNSIQDQQRKLPKVIKNLTVVPAIDLPLSDPIHISGLGQQRLGRRLVQATLTLLKHKPSLKPPIELKTIVPKRNPLTNTLDIEVVFDNVEGTLCAQGRPTGFDLINSNILRKTIFRSDLEKNKVIIRTGIPACEGETGFNLHYGYSSDTYCNITDQADRAIPVFGPVPIDFGDRSLTPVRKLRIGKILPGADKLENVICPDTADKKLKWASREFTSSFANLHEELQTCTNDATVFFATKFNCAKVMKLQVGFGYDGPVKLWINGKQAFYDPDGINPMISDQAMIPFNAKPGTHEIIVAFSANFGKAWGISLRLHNKGFGKKKKIKPSELPEVLG
jgi:sialate O-acetylesterase